MTLIRVYNHLFNSYDYIHVRRELSQHILVILKLITNHKEIYNSKYQDKGLCIFCIHIKDDMINGFVKIDVLYFKISYVE